jgi:hypothetical protein
VICFLLDGKRSTSKIRLLGFAKLEVGYHGEDYFVDGPD